MKKKRSRYGRKTTQKEFEEIRSGVYEGKNKCQNCNGTGIDPESAYDAVGIKKCKRCNGKGFIK